MLQHAKKIFLSDFRLLRYVELKDKKLDFMILLFCIYNKNYMCLIGS